MAGFASRRDAGRALAGRLAGRALGRPGDPVVVLGLARGGVPVAREVAEALGARLDVLVVRKLGVPSQPELAMGALAAGVRVLNEQVIARMGVTQAELDTVTARERQELDRRERSYRGGGQPAPLAGATVVLVDDGVATGASMRAAARAVRQRGASTVVIAVPVGAPDACDNLRPACDQLVCLLEPPQFEAVGQFFVDFGQVADEAVRDALQAPPGLP